MSSTATIENMEFERYIQSAFRITSDHTTVYIDPHRLEGGPKADLILITHEHVDHLDPDAINTVATEDTVIVANAACAGQIEGKVKGRIVPIAEGQDVREKGVSIRAVPGYNEPFHPRGMNVGFLFTLGGKTVFHSGDTNRVPEWSTLGAIDVALLPIGGTYTMAEQEAAEVVRELKPKVVIPMHYGAYTAGDPQQFASLVGEGTRVVIL